MPYASQQQRAFMYSQHPDIARRWDAEGKNYIVGKKRSSKRQTRRTAGKRY